MSKTSVRSRTIYCLLLLLPVWLTAEVRLISADWETVSLSVTLPVPEVTPIVANGTSYVNLSLPDAGVSTDIGRPALPVIRRLVEIPFGAEVSVSATEAVTERMPLPHPVLPLQLPVPKSGPAPEFVIDEKAYRTHEFLPGTWARIADIAEVRHHRLALVEILPVRYHPVENLIEYLRTARIELKLSGSNQEKTRQQFHEFYSLPFEQMLRGIVPNLGTFISDPPPALPIGYLIIVPDALYNSVRPLADWRRQKGLKVTVTKLSEIGGGGNTQVQAYIQNAYNTWPVKPSYVLLVGDVNFIGYFVGQGAGSPHTDLNYSLVAGGDYLPDICVSRASVTSAAELESLVTKTIRYEKNEWSGGTAWCGKSFFIGSADGSNHTIAEGTHRYCMAKIRPLGVICDSQYLYYQNARQITIDKINEGRSFVIYSGHGGETEWAEHSPLFDVTCTHTLANPDRLPFVATFACLSGSYASVGECFSESWIRTGYRGAIAHIASSVTSYWTEDDTLQRRLFDCLYDSSYHWIMAAVNKSKIWYYAQMGNSSTTRRYFEMYNLMGDGAVDIYSLVPRALNVTHPVVIPLGTYVLHVVVQSNGSPVPKALVCAAGRSDTAVHAAGYTDNFGVVDLTITTTSPDSVRLTVTGHNLEPYLGAVLALPSSGPYIMRLRSTIDDAPPAGNGDGIVNPGEVVNLPTWVKNYGSGTGYGIIGILRSTDPAAVVTDSLRIFGDIPANDSVWSGNDAFKFRAADTCTNGHNLTFVLHCRDNRDSTWSSPFSIPVGTGIISYQSKRIYDPGPGGNNNGRLDPNETAELYVTLKNTGLGHGYNVRAILRSGDRRLHIEDSAGFFGTIRRDSAVENQADCFVVRTDPGIIPETSIPCTLLIAADGGYTRLQSFTIVIGEMRTIDPIPDDTAQPVYWAYDNTDTGYVEVPRFSWIETRGRGIRLNLSDDQTVQVNLPGSFGPWKFYGNRYTQLSICSNGWIAPGSVTSTVYTNQPLPSTTLPAPAVCLSWDDLYPPVGGGVWWFHDTANHAFVVEWDSVAYYSPQTSWDKFQIVIWDTTRPGPDGVNNVLVVQYLTANNYTSNTVGIQNGTRNRFIPILYNGSYHRGAAVLQPNSAIKYTTGLPVTAVAEPAAVPAAPSGLGLKVTPNPLQKTTRITYQYPGAGPLSLKLFDAAGRLVREFDASALRTGKGILVWQRDDSKGRAVGAGIYFCTLTAGDKHLTTKVVVTE